MLVDTNGFLLHVLVHEANTQDHTGGKLLLEPLGGYFPRLQLIWADSGYKKGGFVQWVKATLGWTAEIVEHAWSGIRSVWVPEGVEVDWEKIRPSGFHVLKWRWIVEPAIPLALYMAQTRHGLRSLSQQSRRLDSPRHEPHHAQAFGSK